MVLKPKPRNVVAPSDPLPLVTKRMRRREVLVRISALFLIYVLAFSIRLFSVVRFESMIHEYDPQFNYRATLVLVQDGLHDFWNWFDTTAWYPLGRFVGATVYPGLMLTAAATYWILRCLRFFVHIREVCVFTAPFFASNTTIVAYLFGKEIWDSGAGLFAAVLVAICPGYIMRSVAGSYDNEAVAIFAMLLTFYLFVKAVKTGSMGWALASALAYLYMVSTWGAYLFVTNLIPLYVVALLVMGRYSVRLYVAYSCMFVLGTLLAMQITTVGFRHVRTAEHMFPIAVFFFLQVFCFLDWVKHLLKINARCFVIGALALAAVVGALIVVVGMAFGYISPFSGRVYLLLDPTYVKNHLPAIASVAEHRPSNWSSYIYAFHFMRFLFPFGLIYLCFKRFSEGTIFIIIYGFVSIGVSYRWGRLIILAAPAVCLVSAIALSALVKKMASITLQKTKITSRRGARRPPKALVAHLLLFKRIAAFAVLLVVIYSCYRYTRHCTLVTNIYHSSPQVVTEEVWADGGIVINDEFREAYYWLRQNTPPDAKIMSWWDYGYQISAMADRTVIIDNNTWNNTHMATVGRAFASSEDEAYEIVRSLDVDYILVVFGGVTGDTDDISIFPWMVRIGGGVYPEIKELDYLTNGIYHVGRGASPKMLNSLMYKLCYFRFGQLFTTVWSPPGFDHARRVEIGYKDIQLTYFEEAYTTSNWRVRIYKVKPPSNRS